MRIVLAGLFVVGLAGCPDDVFDMFGGPGTGVCAAAYGSDGLLCYEATDGSTTDRQRCDEDRRLFVEDTTCAEVGTPDLCREEDGIAVYGDSPETCAAFVAGESETPQPAP